MAHDEFERIDAVEQYHRRNKVRLPNVRVHALFHAIVENQVALGDKYPTKPPLARLMNEGLNRHEAIHAISTVLTGAVNYILKREKAGHNLTKDYDEGLKKLTADSWRKMEA
jgi:hypothetical protein